MANEEIEWCPLKGWEGIYEISSHGQIRSLERLIKNGKALYKSKVRILKGVDRRDGYLSITLKDGDHLERWLIHRLVLTTFVGPCPDGMEALHGPDRNRQNNKLCNLRWGTRADNEYDKIAHGISNRGERQWNSKLTSGDISEMFGMQKAGHSQTTIARYFRIHPSHVSKTFSGQRWAHLGLS